jgi:lipopolysaccharide/colanic/teichoic acid biosynthesis glycosyltransferase
MYPYIKRFFDLLFAILIILVLILLLFPLLVAILIILKCTAEGEIFYRQKRIGRNSEAFYMWKFATMLKNSPNMGAGTLTVQNDPRVTKIGRFLRRSKLNEIPQLINILQGDMSFIGPRPLDDKGYFSYPEAIRDQIFRTQPGITGIGSVVFRNEEALFAKTHLPPRTFYDLHIAPYKGALEIWYQQNQSFITDFTLLWLTICVILFPNSNLVFKVFPTLPERPSFL